MNSFDRTLLRHCVGQLLPLYSAAELERAATGRGRAAEPFGWEWEQKYLSAYVGAAPSKFHIDLLRDLRDLHKTRGTRLNYRGPRGSGKTAHISKAYPLWCALEGVEPLTLLLAETGEQASIYLKAIKTELESNPKILADYPHAAGVGPVWRDDRITLRNGSTIIARGTAGRVLGLTQGAHRPTLVIGDDLNQRGDAYSPTMRRRKIDWFLKDVMKVGGPTTNFLVAGTSIHREAITCELTRNPAWTTRRYRSILDWPVRTDMWAEWELVFSNLGDPDRRENARKFYESNSVEMDRGHGVLWPDRYPLYDLMCDRAESGPGPFASERQDEEGTDGSTEWPAEYFDRSDLWFLDWPDDLIVRSYFLDPSKGRQDRAGDYQAHVWGGWSKKENALYVEADLRREPGPEMVKRAAEQAKRFHCAGVTVEGNSDGVGLLVSEWRRCAVGVSLETIHHTDPKLSRIRSLGPLLARGQLKVRNTPGGKLLVDQLRDVPAGEFDDGPDAAAALYKTILAKLRGT